LQKSAVDPWDVVHRYLLLNSAFLTVVREFSRP